MIPIKRSALFSILLIGSSILAAYSIAGTFTEPPSVSWHGPPDPILVGAGDIGDCTTPYAQATAKLLASIGGTIFTAGDNAYDHGTEAQFLQCYDPMWGRYKQHTYPVPGNHEYENHDGAAYYAYFGKRAGPAGRGYYSYDLGGWHIVALNSNIDTQAASQQAAWLRDDLAAHSTDCMLAYWHHPLWSSGHYGNDLKMQDVWRILYQFRVDVVINGHEHSYERFAPQDADGRDDPQDGIREFVVGTGGTTLRAFHSAAPNSQVRNDETHGVLKLVLHPTSYDWEFVPIEGQAFHDTGLGACTVLNKP